MSRGQIVEASPKKLRGDLPRLLALQLASARHNRGDSQPYQLSVEHLPPPVGMRGGVWI
jgi:hypothetical protein